MGVMRNVKEHSRREHRHEQRRAAERDERQRQALRRQEPGDDAQVHDRLGGDEDRDPQRQVRAEGLGGAEPDPQAAPREHDEQADDRQGADEPELLADDREDEVGVRLGQVEELLARAADALPEEAPVAEREPRLDDLEAAAAEAAGGGGGGGGGGGAPRARPPPPAAAAGPAGSPRARRAGARGTPRGRRRAPASRARRAGTTRGRGGSSGGGGWWGGAAGGG